MSRVRNYTLNQTTTLGHIVLSLLQGSFKAETSSADTDANTMPLNGDGNNSAGCRASYTPDGPQHLLAAAAAVATMDATLYLLTTAAAQTATTVCSDERV